MSDPMKILLIIELLARLAATIQENLNLIRQAQAEGRDISENELEAVKSSAKKSLDSLGELLNKKDGENGS